ncbi:peptidyl-prolyl cis-trans isomerase [Algoriphagus marinus]|uniref:peptidylprolyl isomerase n=1 Tax=Algoriphagus marinus TaxID=1925762 RepID=UPI00094BC522|nr:peptidylprolyl isomerase [Algoriphagus marinus]
MKKFLKEPLLHFMLLGTMIFGYYYLTNDIEDAEAAILIDDAEYDYLLSLWKNQWQREPNEDDIKAFLDQYLRQEVFYKEALALNLDHNDIIVKRRLAQKMEAVSNDLNFMMNPPTDEELKSFFASNPDLFQLPPSFTFQQVLFLASEENLSAQMEINKIALNEGEEIPDSRKLKLSLANQWDNSSLAEISKAFGDDFALALDSIPNNQWVGPIASGFGQHLVFISKKDNAETADFEDIKPYVLNEFEYQSELRTQEKIYLDLLEKYGVKITSEKVPDSVKESFNNQ